MAARYRPAPDSAQPHPAWIFRVTGGRLGARVAGQPVLLLTTTGRRTGRQLTTPVHRYEIAGRTGIVASNGGSATSPAWRMRFWRAISHANLRLAEITRDPVSDMRVLIVGGGVAALEAMLALRRLAEERVEIVLVSPEKTFAYRPLSVAEPFGLGAERRFDLAEIAVDAGAEICDGRVCAVDAAAHTVTTGSGSSLEYDALVIACGARRHAPFPEALTFWGRGGCDQMTELLEDLEGGWVASVAFVLPGGCGWPLPLYELALLTSSHLAADGEHGVELMIVTPEAAPLEVFGAEASDEIRHLLNRRGIGLFTGSRPSAFRPGELSLEPAGALRVERMVTLPRLEGPGIEGLPAGPHGFVPVDLHGRVPGLEDVYAAGDATTVPIKQGGLAAQLADAVAAEIAVSAGAAIEPEPFQPVLRGMLLTGDTPRYLRADFAEGAGEVSTVADHALWWPPSKIAGRHLAPYLATLVTSEFDRPVPSARARVPVEIEIDAKALAGAR